MRTSRIPNEDSGAGGKRRVRLAVNNLFDDHSILGVNPAATKTSVAAPGDVLNIMAARSVSLSFTVGVAPAKRPSGLPSHADHGRTRGSGGS